jgi:hypothetical protein
MIFYSVFMSAFTLTCIGLAAYKLAMFVKAKGCQESIPQTMLIFEIVANTSKRFIALKADTNERVFSSLLPCSSRSASISSIAAIHSESNVLHHKLAFRYHQPLVDQFLLVRFFLSPPFSDSIARHELISKTSVKINTFLAKLKIPFWCIFAVILALELTASILRSLQLNLEVFLIVMGACYIVIGLTCSTFYIVTGVKLTRALGSVATTVSNSNRTKRLNSVSAKMDLETNYFSPHQLILRRPRA